VRVFLDTNVVVAAAATRGLCADVMREVLARHDLVVSEVLLTEIATVLEAKIGVSTETVSALASLLREAGEIAKPSDPAHIPLPDGPDRTLLAAAMAGRADVFITGDSALLELGTIGPMAVVGPRAFWERVRAGVGPFGP